MDRKSFETDCGEIVYWVSRASDGSPQLAFLPGLTADHRLFGPQVECFEGRATCLVWDPPSHGLSRPFAPTWTMDDLARWLCQILAAEGLARPVLVGQSMGGYVAQAFLDLFPGEAAGFVSIDSCPLGREYYTALELWALRHVRGMYRAIPWKTLLNVGPGGVSTTEASRALMREMMLDYTKDEYLDLAACGYRALAGAVEAGRAYRVDCPTLLICGEHDAAGSARRYNRAWARRTGLPIEWVAGAGHNANVDAPEAVNALIERLL